MLFLHVHVQLFTTYHCIINTMSTSFDSNPYLTWLIQHEKSWASVYNALPGLHLIYIHDQPRPQGFPHTLFVRQKPWGRGWFTTIFLRLLILNVFLAIPEAQIFKIFRGRMPPDPLRKLTPSALGTMPAPPPPPTHLKLTLRSLWVMNNKCRGWMNILSNKLTLVILPTFILG